MEGQRERANTEERDEKQMNFQMGRYVIQFSPPILRFLAFRLILLQIFDKIILFLHLVKRLTTHF